jgi:methylmalonyl-CoA/ethylmalonyl-CoA epimerase
MKHVDHVGIAVADLDEARKTWDALLRQTPVVEDVPTQRVRTATYPCGIELVAATSPESPIARFLAKRGPGIHHVTVAVDDIRTHLARLKAQGVKLVNETPVKGAGGCPVAFLHPVGGVLVELKEKR